MNEMHVFDVPDMSCAHCVATIRDALGSALPGAMQDINLEAHRVSIAGDAERAETAIREAGYTPRRIDPA
ncbi:hypothetical protein GCM10007989_26740 [Devosia pacifica]|uniref:HMA domain-containing protein n=1 Tax=Devosia pacifica TaxID=1335967 RepID=A0A918S892_9HYPH|nr:heavy-metal-associated domain-containing protein [Devosia pacifica]GHA29747.1 hypothetical protein GCM10007989_26740 [Devosia pacifica]